MTAPYRLRDAIGDDQATIGLIGVFGACALLGGTPAIVDMYSLGAPLMLLYVTAVTAVVLMQMHRADRRLREVSSS